VAEIEFLTGGVSEPDLAAVDHSQRTTAWRRHLPTTIAAALWTAAATLCVLAPFSALFSEDVPDAGTQGLDGWGRLFRSISFQDDLSAFHGARYGVVLIACALVFSLLALLTATLAWSQPRWARSAPGTLALRRGVPAVAFTICGITAGTATAALLDAMSSRDNFTATMSNAADGGFGFAGATPAFRIGPMPWLTLAAAVCALAAALAACVTPPEVTIDEPAAMESPPIWAPPHEDDEMLAT